MMHIIVIIFFWQIIADEKGIYKYFFKENATFLCLPGVN